MASHELQLSDDPVTRCGQVISQTKLITFALFMGLFVITIVFGVLVYGVLGPLVPNGFDPLNVGLPMLTLIGILVLALALLGLFSVSRGMVTSFQRRWGAIPVPRTDAFAADAANDLSWTQQVPKEPLFAALNLFMSQRITRMALIEGPGILNAIFFLMEGQPISLAAVGCALALIATHYPSPAYLNRWLRHVLEAPGQPQS